MTAADTALDAPRLRPLSVGELLDAAFKLYRSRFGALTLCVLVAVVPLSILTTLVQASTSETAFELDATATAGGGSAAAAGQLVVLVLTVLMFGLASAACLRIVSGAYLGRDVTWQESLAFAGRRVGAIVGVLAILTVLLIVAFVALVLPGIWLSVITVTTLPVLLVEGVGGFAAVRRSVSLVRGRWWPTFGTVLVAYVITTVLTLVVAAIVGATILADAGNEVLVAIVLTLANVLSYAVSLPILAAVATLVYFDLRVRKEGFDLHLLAERVGEPGVVRSAGTSAAEVGAQAGLGGSWAPPADDGSGFAPPRAEGGGSFAPPRAEGDGSGFAPPRADAEPGGESPRPA